MKTKKLLALVMATLSLSCLFACNKKQDDSIKTFTDLKNNQTLFVGSDNTYTNATRTETKEMTLSYVEYYNYTLVRSFYETSDSVEYEGYYYYWNVEPIYQDLVLGTRTTVSTITHEYLPYGEDECIVVKETLVTQTSFDYAGGFISQPFEYEMNLNGYFSSYNTLKNTCPTLASKVNVSKVKRYYVDTKIPAQKDVNIESFEHTYFYITED